MLIHVIQHRPNASTASSNRMRRAAPVLQLPLHGKRLLRFPSLYQLPVGFTLTPHSLLHIL